MSEMRVNGVSAIGKKPYKWVKSRALLIGLHCMGGKNNLCVSRMVNGLQRTSQVSDSAVVVAQILRWCSNVMVGLYDIGQFYCIVQLYLSVPLISD